MRARKTAVFFIALMVVHAGNYGIQLMLGRWLGPENFADYTAVFGLWLMLEVLTLTVQTVATTRAAESPDLAGQIGYELRRYGRWIAPLCSVLIIFAAGFLVDLLQLSCGPVPIWLIALCLPFSVDFAIERGLAQAHNQLGRLARSLVVEMMARLLFTLLVLLAELGVTHTFTALLLAVAVTHRATKGKFQDHRGTGSLPGLHSQFGLVALGIAASQWLALSDLLTIKAVYSPFQAGQFSGFYLVGKVVLLCSSPLYLLLLSRPGQAVTRSQQPLRVLLRLGSTSVGLSALAAICCTAVPSLWLWLLGPRYEAGLPILPAIAWSSVALVGLLCCLNYSLAVGCRRTLWWLLMVALLQPVVIVLSPSGPADACWMVAGYRSAGGLAALAILLRNGLSTQGIILASSLRGEYA